MNRAQRERFTNNPRIHSARKEIYCTVLCVIKKELLFIENMSMSKVLNNTVFYKIEGHF